MSDKEQIVNGKMIAGTSFLQASLAGKPVAADQTLGNGANVRCPASGAVQFTPATPSQKSLLLSAGVHGNETAPIELLDYLVDDLLSERLNVHCNLLIVLANIPAIQSQQRFLEQNLNRLFSTADEADSTSHSDNEIQYEQKRAKELCALSERFFAKSNCPSVHYDLHTAIRRSRHEKFAVSPNGDDNQQLNAQFSVLAEMGIEAVLQGSKSSGTFSAFTSQHCAACSFTIELGQVKPFGENDFSKLQNFDQALRSQIDPTLSAKKGIAAPKVYSILREVTKQTENFSLCFDDDTPNFTSFPKGTALTQDAEYSYKTTEDKECIVFPNANVAVGQRALLLVKETKSRFSCSKEIDSEENQTL